MLPHSSIASVTLISGGRDPGGSAVMDRYSALRAPDVNGRITAIDLLNRTLLSPYLPVHLMRGFGLHVLNNVDSLRRLVVKEGVQPTSYVPTLMRSGGIDLLRAGHATAGMLSPA